MICLDLAIKTTYPVFKHHAGSASIIISRNYYGACKDV